MEGMEIRQAPAVIKHRTVSFADEWQARDIPLSRSEVCTVKRAADALGLPIRHTPTGRTTQLVIQHAMNVALQKASETKNERVRAEWYAVYLKAKSALGRSVN